MAQVPPYFELNVSSEFIESGKSLKTGSKKRGGPYSKDEKIKRQNEVHKLHFGFGHSARKISELMKVNRNTINRDINYLLAQLDSTMHISHPELFIAESIEKLNVQKIRLCEMLYNSSSNSEKILLERMIFQSESKIIQITSKLLESNNNMDDYILNSLNEINKNNKKDERLISTRKFQVCSDKAKEKIDKILKEDKRF